MSLPAVDGALEPAGSTAARHSATQRTWVVRRAGLLLAAVAVVFALAAVVLALLAPGSREVMTSIGDLPVSPQDEMRVSAEVWFSLVMGALALPLAIAWWRALPRGPLGMVGAALGAASLTGLGSLVWRLVVSLRGFSGAAAGEEHLKAPVLTSTAAMWVAAVVATVTYLVLAIVAERSDLLPASAMDRRGPADVEAA